MVGHTVLLYRPNPCEINYVKASELLKRRQIRIMQVRRMSKVHSASARNLYRGKKIKHVDYESRCLRRQQLLADFALLQSKQSALNGVMDSFGCGHRNASSWRDPVIEEQKRLSTTRVVAKKRFVEAYNDLLITRARSLQEAEIRRHLRETVRAAERTRAANVAALPPPSRDPLDPHLNPNGDPCARCLSGDHKECHLVMNANQVPLESATWGEERAKEVEKGSRVLGGEVSLEKGRCGSNVCRIEPSCVDVVANDDAFTTALAENERADRAHQSALRLAAEAALKSRIRSQLALKRTYARQAYRLLMQQLDTAPVGEAEIAQTCRTYDVSSFSERPSQISPDAKPIESVRLDAHSTALVHPNPDPAGLGPGRRTDSPSLALSPCHGSIAHPRSLPQSLVFHQRPSVLPLSIATNYSNSHTSGAKIVGPCNSSEPTGLHPPGTDAPNAFKPLEVRLHDNKFTASESYGVSGLDNSRPSPTVLSGITSFDRIKIQLEYELSFLSEVENIDKAIRALRESFNNSILSEHSAQDIEVNLPQICPPSTSSDSATTYPQSPFKIFEMVERPETTTVTGVGKDSALYHVEKSPSGFIDGRIAIDTVRAKW
ncbi:hypothetical protein TSMEX_006080 [Taenia solium]|eukprot:TsM_000161000 transcript=TsM_000161000 gene=TsM_000161000